MRDPISERHALSLILNNFSQPLRGLISTSPSKSFIELIERAEWLEMGIENGVYEGITIARNSQDAKKKAHFTFAAKSFNNSKGNKNDHGNSLERIKRQKGKDINSDKPLQSSPQHQKKDQEKSKRKDWRTDREFTPLDQTLESILEYMLAKDIVRLPKAADPPAIMGRFKEQFCKFHRAVGHDTENCFVLKNIVQDCIDKKLLVEDEKED